MLKYKNGLSFDRKADGSVAVEAEIRDATGHVADVRRWVIAPQDWVNLVAGLSAEGKAAKPVVAKIHGW